jgi:hypothetical protein
MEGSTLLCQRWSKLKFHYSCSSGEREITVFKTLESPTQISVVLCGPAGQGFTIMKFLKQPRITASLILKTCKGTLFRNWNQRFFDSLHPLRSLPLPFPPFQSLSETRIRGYIEKN